MKGWIAQPTVTLVLVAFSMVAAVAARGGSDGRISSSRALETITVSNASATAVMSQTVLKPKHRYRITASGTISDWCPRNAAKASDCSFGSPLAIGQGVDAIFCYARWRCPKPELWRQLRVNDQGLDEFAGDAGTFTKPTADHVYTVTVEGKKGPLKLGASDALSGSTTDNSGVFTVEVTDLGQVRFGVAFVPFQTGGDEVERAMRLLVASFEDIDRIYNPATPDQLFNLLIKLGKAGKKVDSLVIGGHGSRENPRIDLSQADLEPKDVDLPYMRKRIAVFERALAQGRLSAAQQQELEALKSRMVFLNSVSEAMAPGAAVLLVNCSPAATPTGQQFLRNLGEVLLGKRGGTLVASRSDVELGQVRSLANKIRALVKTGEVVTIGGFFVSGDWVRIPISARR